MEFFLVYILVVLQNIARISIMLSGPALIVSTMGATMLSFSIVEAEPTHISTIKGYISLRNKFYKAIVISLSIIIICTFVPSQKDVAIIAGGGLALKAARNEQVQELPQSILDYLERLLKEQSENE